MTDQPAPVHGCTIDGQPAMPILVSEHQQLLAGLAALRAAEERAGELATMLAAVLAAYPDDLNPHGPAVRPRHLPAGLIQRWRDRLTALCAKEQPEPATAQTTEHVYLSTGCHHGDHAYCQGMTGLNGAKRPGECKHCGAKCICSCHQADAPATARTPSTAESGADSADSYDGPSVAECAEADRVWSLEKTGE